MKRNVSIDKGKAPHKVAVVLILVLVGCNSGSSQSQSITNPPNTLGSTLPPYQSPGQSGPGTTSSPGGASKPACPNACLWIPSGKTQAQVIADFEAQNNCVVADACQPTIRIDRSFTIKNELGPYKVTEVDVPCSLSVRKIPSKNPKAPPSYSCTPTSPGKTCRSGMTVSAGIDLAYQSVNSLNAMGINATQNADLFNLLTPYLPPPQRTGCAAAIYLKEHPLNITATQAQTFDNLAYASYEGGVVKAYDKETGQNFALLPAPVQTTLFDYYYWHGNIGALVPYIKTGNWNGVVSYINNKSGATTLTNFKKRYSDEAKNIQSSINDGSLKEYAQCLKK